MLFDAFAYGEYVGRGEANGEPGLEFTLRMSSDIGVFSFGITELDRGMGVLDAEEGTLDVEVCGASSGLLGGALVLLFS